MLLDERGSGGAGLVSLERRLDHLRALLDDGSARRDQLLRLYVRGQALRTVLLRAGGGGPAAASSAKLLRTELEFDIEELLSTMRGPEGLLGGPATDRFLYAPGMRIAGGTSEIQRNIIAERVLGLPREPPPRGDAAGGPAGAGPPSRSVCSDTKLTVKTTPDVSEQAFGWVLGVGHPGE